MSQARVNNLAGRWRALRDRIVIHEDTELLALNKPPGLSVLGDATENDILRIAREAGEELRPVHRIDKVTSGLVLLAQTEAAHAALTRQFNQQTVEKTYLCVVEGTGLPERGRIDLPLTTGRKNRVRVAAQREAIRRRDGEWFVSASDVRATGRVYPSETRFTVLWEGEGRTLLAVQPVTGRRHQIRVHLAWIGYPVAGDPLFAPKGAAPQRTLLHSWRLAFDAVDGSGRTTIEAPPDAGFPETIPMPVNAFAAALGSTG
jgi:tRNA pseudouridine32 synthase/23S rRNA pseudouridine746 synthase/23S rRNA pseudouridine1911/1915/1917 synthase